MLFTSNEVKRMAISMQNDPYLNNCGTEDHPKHVFSKNDLKITDRLIGEIVPSMHKACRNEERPEYEFVLRCRMRASSTKDPLTKRAYLWLGFAAKNICKAKLVELEAVDKL